VSTRRGAEPARTSGRESIFHVLCERFLTKILAVIAKRRRYVNSRS